MTDLLGSAKHVIAIDHLVHATTLKADIVLPAAAFAESSGSLVNNEGRAQRFYRVFLPKGQVRESWRWIRDMMRSLGRPEAEKWHILDDVAAAIAAAVPALGALPSVAPGAGFRLTGGKVPRQSHRYSGRTAMRAQIDVHEHKTPRRPGYAAGLFDGGRSQSAPVSAYPPILGAGLGFGAVPQQIPGRGRRAVARRRSRHTPHRASPADKAGMVRRHPGTPAAGGSQWLFVPLHHIFGSEELSVLSPGIAELCPKPYVALHPEDASALGMAEGDAARAVLGDSVLELCVKIVPSLPRKVAGLPVGLPGAPVLDLPASGMVLKGKSDG